MTIDQANSKPDMPVQESHLEADNYAGAEWILFMSDAEESAAHESLSKLYAHIQQVNFLPCVGLPGRHLYQALHARFDEGCKIFEKRFGREWAPF